MDLCGRGTRLGGAARMAVHGALGAHCRGRRELPDHERRGYGPSLHDTMLEWLWSTGLERLWLTTEPGTRAQRFYEAAGWQLAGSTESGELRYERSAAQG